MSKFVKDRIMLALACATIFGGNTQAAQNVKTAQSLGAVGGRQLVILENLKKKV